ncbi:hypothetical protein, partial [uncultured Clostridium sp.]|uniref:hypothetical protein n=1 Tax=uncultured Clostridium sp. TaxID=59620 RepID=UPI0025E2A6D5
ALSEVLSSLVQKRAVAGFFESSIRFVFHKRERVPEGIFFSGFPFTTLNKPGLKTHPPKPPHPVRHLSEPFPHLNCKADQADHTEKG